jgi:hypothetical protein
MIKTGKILFQDREGSPGNWDEDFGVGFHYQLCSHPYRENSYPERIGSRKEDFLQCIKRRLK